jgi:hypothetical protein
MKILILLMIVIDIRFSQAESDGWEIWSSDLNSAPEIKPNSTYTSSPKRKLLLEGKLRHAASNGNFSLFETTLSLGYGGQIFNIWAGDRHGRTWLHFAAMNGYGGDKQQTPPNFLMRAFQLLMPPSTPIELVQKYIDIRDLSGQTPLHEAALNGWNITFKSILDLGGSLTARAKPLQGEWALGWTMMNHLATSGPAQTPDIAGRAAKVAALDGIIQYHQVSF